MIFNLDMSFNPQWKDIQSIRYFVNNVFATGIIDVDDSKRVSTAASELIENIMDYTGNQEAKIGIHKNTDNSSIDISVTNYATPADTDYFKKIMVDVQDGSPRDSYKKMILRLADDPDESHLGLTRIRYECQGVLSYEIQDRKSSGYDFGSTNHPADEYSLLKVKVNVPVAFLD